eukprot:13085708-Alexandrium_andersonii.AAC.1
MMVPYEGLFQRRSQCGARFANTIEHDNHDLLGEGDAGHQFMPFTQAVSYTHLRAHETSAHL